ncbi:hypothetical protein AVEN_68979-1 [Araneus ventricosus]|uniref:Uncharacterized protein n=1 Tax=Araneus ventricosus TaxID=182803 RepID=A0A4Y2TCK9_ARAVE|nr:hypothetical protein AVEN_163812-1 [Araneus ventricosus]GBN96835.1 hypothetical protein AVEN_68979-1 [Araneus ventricosus]
MVGKRVLKGKYGLTSRCQACAPDLGDKLADNIVTNMENLFPVMFVLWLGREFYTGKYGMTGSSQAWNPDLGDHLGEEMWDLENPGIFSISPLGDEVWFIQIIPFDVTACRGDYKRTEIGSRSRLCVD